MDVARQGGVVCHLGPPLPAPPPFVADQQIPRFVLACQCSI